MSALCRLFGHKWVREHPIDPRRPMWIGDEITFCDRCGPSVRPTEASLAGAAPTQEEKANG